MSAILSGSAAGRMPALDNMPMAVIHCLLQLEKLPCVYVVDSITHEHGIQLQIAFSNAMPPRYREALNCFKGLRPVGFRLNGQYRYMQLTVQSIKAIA